MPIEMIDPSGLSHPHGYHHVAVATGTRLVFVAGQTARIADGSLVGEGDLAAQIEQVYVNLDIAMRAAGGSFDDITRLVMYLVDYSPDKLPAIGAGIGAAAKRLGVDTRKAMTLIGVAALVDPEILVEVEIAAVLP
jgi:enamine deaminase RidA (YjgF/YER057c/UK114 family)